MKKLKTLALCIYCLFYFQHTKAQSNVATLLVTGDETNNYVTVLVPYQYGIETKKDTIRLVAGKMHTYKVPLTKPLPVVLEYGKNGQSSIWLKPGGSLKITLHNNVPQFAGNLAPYAQYYASDREFWKKIDAEYYKRNPQYQKEADLHTDKYFAIQDSTFIDRINFLKSYFKQVNNKDIATRITNSFDIKRHRLNIEAPNTLRTPISFVRCSAINLSLIHI